MGVMKDNMTLIGKAGKRQNNWSSPQTWRTDRHFSTPHWECPALWANSRRRTVQNYVASTCVCLSVPLHKHCKLKLCVPLCLQTRFSAICGCFFVCLGVFLQAQFSLWYKRTTWERAVCHLAANVAAMPSSAKQMGRKEQQLETWHLNIQYMPLQSSSGFWPLWVWSSFLLLRLESALH